MEWDGIYVYFSPEIGSVLQWINTEFYNYPARDTYDQTRLLKITIEEWNNRDNHKWKVIPANNLEGILTVIDSFENK